MLEKQNSTSVIKVGVAYMNICILRHIKEELAWAIDKQLHVISYIVNSYVVMSWA